MKSKSTVVRRNKAAVLAAAKGSGRDGRDSETNQGKAG